LHHFVLKTGTAGGFAFEPACFWASIPSLQTDLPRVLFFSVEVISVCVKLEYEAYEGAIINARHVKIKFSTLAR